MFICLNCFIQNHENRPSFQFHPIVMPKPDIPVRGDNHGDPWIWDKQTRLTKRKNGRGDGGAIGSTRGATEKMHRENGRGGSGRVSARVQLNQRVTGARSRALITADEISS